MTTRLERSPGADRRSRLALTVLLPLLVAFLLSSDRPAEVPSA